MAFPLWLSEGDRKGEGDGKRGGEWGEEVSAGVSYNRLILLAQDPTLVTAFNLDYLLKVPPPIQLH